MDQEEHGEISDEEMAQALHAEERAQCRPMPFSWRRVFAGWLDTVGGTLEHLAEFPYVLSRALLADRLNDEDNQIFVDDARDEIERMTGG